MPTHAEKRIVLYSPEQMFDLILDIEKYPEFLPWCNAAQVRERGKDYLIGDLTIGYKMMSSTYRSKVVFNRPHRIDIEYVEGPFKHLKNHWQFKTVNNGCEIDFFIDFEFKSSLFQHLMEYVFNAAVRVMINAFETRASVIANA